MLQLVSVAYYSVEHTCSNAKLRLKEAMLTCDQRRGGACSYHDITCPQMLTNEQSYEV